jgi:hypothetical protein
MTQATGLIKRPRYTIVLGAGIIAIGVLVAAVPKTVYTLVEQTSDMMMGNMMMGNMVMQCHLTANIEIGVGLAILALGLLYVISKSTKIKLTASIFVLALAATSLLFPTNWTGLCESEHMACHMITLPVLIICTTILSIIALVGIAFSVRTLRQESAPAE